MQALGKKCCIIWHFLPSTLLFYSISLNFFDDLSFFFAQPTFSFHFIPPKNFLPLLKFFPPPKNFPPLILYWPLSLTSIFLGPPKSGGGVLTLKIPPASAPLPLNLKLHPLNLHLHPSTSTPLISNYTPPPPPPQPPPPPLNLKLYPLNLQLLTSNYSPSTSTS